MIKNKNFNCTHRTFLKATQYTSAFVRFFSAFARCLTLVRRYINDHKHTYIHATSITIMRMPTSNWDTKLARPEYGCNSFSCGNFPAGGRYGKASRGANNANKLGGRNWVMIVTTLFNTGFKVNPLVYETSFDHTTKNLIHYASYQWPPEEYQHADASRD